MTITSMLDRLELALAGSFLTLAVIWFAGDERYDSASFFVMGAYLLVQLLKRMPNQIVPAKIKEGTING